MMKKFFAKPFKGLSVFVSWFAGGSGSSRISRWYNTNGIYRFPIGSVVALVDTGSFGYGVRPIGVVKGHAEGGEYIIKMECDSDGNFFEWNKGQYVPSGRRSSQREIHFKRNIENHFRKVPRADVELAYA